jgi:hypothetical protein
MSAAEKLQQVKAEPEHCRITDKGDVPVKSISLDPSKANLLPIVTSSLHVGKRGTQGWTCHSLLLIARIRAIQVVFRNSAGKEDIRMVPEHMVLDWQPEV